MSLQVWLPLTKDLRNQGLGNVTIDNSGATFETNGKLGGCYNLTGGPIVLSNLSNPTEISVAFWFKRTANTGTRQFMFTAWNGVTCELTTDGKPTFAVYRSSYPTIVGDVITTSTGWVHYCGTFSTTKGMKLYINGSLVGSDSNTAAIVWNTTTGQIGKFSSYASMSAQMNDFRIYDHCLSETEVKRLAQGLVLHYPLNNNGLGNENLYGYGSDCSDVSRLNQSTNKFTVTTDEGHVCAHATGALQTTAYLQSQIPFYPKALEYCTFSAYVKLKNIVRGTTNAMCGFYFSGQTIDGAWRGVQNLGLTVDGVKYSSTAQDRWDSVINDGKWHYVTCTARFLNYPYTADLRPNIYFRDCTGDMYLHHIKYERGQIATPWCENSLTPIALENANDPSTYVEPDGSRWLRIFHHNNPASYLFASTDNFEHGFYKDANRWYRVESVCRLINKYEFMVKQKPTSDGTESKYRWIQTKNPSVATYADVQPSAVTRITTSGYTDGTYGGLYKSTTGLTRLTIADSSSGDWWGATGSWTDYSGGIPGYPKVKVTNGYMDLYVRIDNLPLGGLTEYDISGFCNNGTRTGTLDWTDDTPKYTVSTEFPSGNNYIDCGASQEVLPTDELTVSLWINASNWFNPISCTEGGGWNFENPSNIRFPVYVASVGYKVATSGVDASTLENEWHMFTGTFDKTNVKIYIDGVLKGTTATGSTNGIGYAANHCYIGAEAASSTSIASAAFEGKISDVRIYATALSATDVKSLYQNTATIDADGTIHGQIRN